MKIAVTAASGKLGATIVKQLVKDIGKNQVVGIARTPAKAKHLGVEVRPGDYNSREQFDIALKGIDAVLIVSGMDAPEKRIAQHRNIIEAAKTNGVKKIVYTSIIGEEAKTAFSPVVKSNRQTEQDIQRSGLDWVIGRNGLYIEPDFEYLEHYTKAGEIANCAGNGQCAYTSRTELAVAYSHMLQEEQHNGHVYHLVGEPITQAQLTEYINQVFGTNLSYRPMTTEEYLLERKAALGDFMGTIIGGIYNGIQQGTFNPESQFDQATGRPHLSALAMAQAFKKAQEALV
ncbi:SDR family oxidoreductase [Microscilla marina]|uniref:NAD(P)-binding domain-containing protein n=1 Tax=Microscilla marina ATCC 23134 TaxID=313606 RepID=A1ZL23_MICM2|nr:SDR family oxidoreductase [Microscilla marina]EAY28989.1 conserved hypothetical protein [Microscilla marina ATCC 23134]